MTWEEKASIGLLKTLLTETHKIRVYHNRLAVWRHDGQRLTWEELQAVKQSVWGNVTAVEIYPPEKDVVNLRHTRHLWHSGKLTAAVLADCKHPEFDKEAP